MCCSSTRSFLQSKQSRACSYVAGFSKIVRFGEDDFSGIVMVEMGDTFPAFLKAQFWDEKSVTLLDGSATQYL